MIVRIQGEGQFELDDNERQELDLLDSKLFQAIESGNAETFAGALAAALVVTQLPQWPYSTKQESTLPTALRSAIPAGDPVSANLIAPAGDLLSTSDVAFLRQL